MYETAQAANIGYQQSGNAAQGLNSAAIKKSVTAEMVNRLEGINGTLRTVIASQKALIERLHGQKAEKDCGETCAPTPSGMLYTLEERLNWLTNSANEISLNQQVLNNLA